jgi:transposase
MHVAAGFQPAFKFKQRIVLVFERYKKERPSDGRLLGEKNPKNNPFNVNGVETTEERPMKYDKYIGMDVHQAMTVVVVLDSDGKVVLETMVATEAAAIVRLMQGLSGPLRVTFEEGTQAAWLYEVVRAYVTEVIVCDPRRNKLLEEGSKGDKVDARKLAELLRAGLLRSVYHGHEETRKLKELVRGYETLSIDTQRTMARIKAIYRGRGIPTPGRGVYQCQQREQWLALLTEPGIRERAMWLYEELDQLQPLRRKAKQAMLEESRRHRAVNLLRTIPQLGPIRSALIVATVDTPHRFRTKRQFWCYVGLAVVTHMSSEYEMQAGRVVRRRKPIATRGLNANCNRRLKEVFISAATGASRHESYKPIVERLQENGMRHEMARLTLARKIAAVALIVWKKGVKFDPKKLNSTT